MTRSAAAALRVALVAAALAGAGVGAKKLVAKYSRRGPSVPTLQVARATLTRQVVAEGILRAVKSTPVAPTEGGQRGQLKIVFLAEDGTPVKQGDVVVRFDETEFVQELARQKAQRVSADARIAKEKVWGTLAVNNRARAAEQASDANDLAQRFKSDDPAIFSKTQMLQAKIDQDLNSARVEYSKSAQTIQRRLSDERLGLLGVDRKRAQIEIDRAQKALAALEVAAPHDGFFILTRDEWGGAMRLGDLVWRGQQVGEVARLEDIEATVFVLEADASGLAPGRKGRLSLEGDPIHAFDVTVRRVATLAKRRDPRVPAQYFETTLEIAGADPQLMKPGKRVRATLDLGDETGLVVPRQAVFDKDDRSVVYVGKDSFDAVPVKLGSGTPGRVIVVEGLHAGDTIALEDPTAPVATASSAAGKLGPTTPSAGSGR